MKETEAEKLIREALDKKIPGTSLTKEEYQELKEKVIKELKKEQEKK